jgi:hypothetical protein
MAMVVVPLLRMRHTSRCASPKCVGAEVDFKPEIYLTMKKKAFLVNPKNKQKLFFLLEARWRKMALQCIIV